MALIQKTAPVGIDVPICRLQERLYNNLTWSSATKGYESYHRGYRNETGDGRLPEVFTSNNDYQEVFTNDSFSATSFFLVSNNRSVIVNSELTTEVDIVFQLNLKELYPAITHRADEEAHKDVFNVLKDNPQDYPITGLVTGIRNVYEDLRITQVNYDDMQPFHLFKVTISVNHDMLNC